MPEQEPKQFLSPKEARDFLLENRLNPDYKGPLFLRSNHLGDPVMERFQANVHAAVHMIHGTQHAA